MPILQLKISRLKDEKHWSLVNRSLVDNPLQKTNKTADTDINKTHYDETPLYLFALLIFLLWTGLQWWYWYNGTNLSPIPLTLITLSLYIFYVYKIVGGKEFVRGAGSCERE